MYILLNSDNTVAEIIPTYDPVFPDVPIEERYEEDFIKKLLKISENTKVEQNWIYDPKANTFSEPNIAAASIAENADIEAEKNKT